MLVADDSNRLDSSRVITPTAAAAVSPSWLVMIRYAKQLEAALKKKRLITRGAAAGVDPNVRNALYLADTADVSEEDIFGNPELMPKLSAALKTITKRKRVKGKPLVDLIATVQRDGSLPACVQVGSNGMSSSSASSVATNNAVPPPTSAQGGISNANRGRGPSVTSAGGRRLHRPPALDDALATSNEEYAANMGQAYGMVHHPGSSASAASISTSVSPVLTSIDTSNSTADDYFRHDWGHNNGGSSVNYGLQQYGGSSTRSAPPSVRGLTSGLLGSGGVGIDSPASSCTTLVAGASPGEGSISGGFSPSTKDELSPAPSGAHATSAHLQRMGAEAAAMGRSVSSMRSTNAAGARMQMPSSAPSIGGGHHWGPRPVNAGGGHLRTPHKRVSVTSSVASTDVDSLDTSHLLEFDDDDDDEGLDGSQLYGPGEMGNVDCYGGPSVVGGGAGGGGQGVSPEELRELEDALLMDNFGSFGSVMGEELLTDTFAEAKGHQSFPDLRNVRASLPPLARTDHTTGGQRGTPRSLSSGGNGSPHVPAVIGASSSNAGSASPVNGAASSLAGNNAGHPRHGQRSMGRARNEVPPRPYTPGKTSRGVSLPWPSQGHGGGVSPRVGSSPRPPTPGTPVGARMAPSPNGRRRGGEEAFPENFALPSANDLAPNGVGGPSPKSRRVGARTFSERFPGSPQAGMVSPRMGFPHVSPRNSGAAGNFNVGACSPLDGGSDRTYFPGPASNTATTAGFATASPAHPSRSHRRSSSSNWGSGSAPRHGGMGDGGIDSSSAENSSVNAGFEMTGNNQNWPGRLGEGVKTSMSEASLCGRQSWGASSSGDTQNPQSNLSPRPAVSATGGGTRPSFKTSTNHGHGVACRRHSSPISSHPSFQTASGSIDSTGESAAAMGHLKTEFTKTEYVHDGGDMNDGNGNEGVGNGGGTSSVGVECVPAWAAPSPMLEAPTLEAGSLWSMEGPHERQESMRAMSEASAAAVAAVTAAAVPSSGALATSSSTLDDLSTRVMTTSMTMDL